MEAEDDFMYFKCVNYFATLVESRLMALTLSIRSMQCKKLTSDRLANLAVGAKDADVLKFHDLDRQESTRAARSIISKVQRLDIRNK